MLYLLGLPIGNTEDITERGRQLIKEQTFFLAEDTRVFKSLLRALEISLEGKTIRSFHDHSSEAQATAWADNIVKGDDWVLVSDAGSPVISDPAYPLVKAVLEGGGEIRSVTGVSSVLCALELSGLPPHPFLFHGFLPRTDSKKRELFKNLKSGTSLFFESPHRMKRTLEILEVEYPDFNLAVCRELTKTYESVYRFKAGDFSENRLLIDFRGEFVLVIYKEKSEQDFDIPVNLIEKYLDGDQKPKALAKIFSKLTGWPIKDIYQKLKSSNQ